MFFNKNEPSHTFNIPTYREKASEAYEALSFLNAVQTYPMGNIPRNAYYAAWEAMKKMPRKRNDISTDPWKAIGPLNRAGRTLGLAFNPQNPNTIYAGTASGGLWRSYTGGQGINAWEKLELGFPVLGVSSIAFAPNDSSTIYIGTGEVYNIAQAGTGAAYRSLRGSYGMGILKSSDGGKNWQKSLDWSYNQERGVWVIKVDPTDPNIVYATTTEGVYKSTNAGETWSRVLNVPMANDIIINPNSSNLILAACGNFQSSGYGIYRSANGGQNWSKVTLGLPQTYIGKVHLNFAPSNPDIVYASIGNGLIPGQSSSWLCRSGNFGLSWNIQTTTDFAMFQGWFSHDVAVNPTNPNVLTIAGVDMWASTDGGSTITPTSTGGAGFVNPPIGGPDGVEDYVHSDIHDVIYHPTLPNAAYLATDGGVFRTTDGGTTFESLNGGFQTAQFYNGTSNSYQDSTFYLGGLQDHGNIRWNGDLTWTLLALGDGNWTSINPQNDELYNFSLQGLFVIQANTATDTAYVLDIPKVGFTTFTAPHVLASDGQTLYAASSAVAKSVNGGASFSLTNNGNPLDPNNTPVLSMDVAWSNPNVVYAATAPTTLFGGSRSKIYATTNGGNSWNNVTRSNLPDRYPMDIAIDPTNEARAYVVWSGFGTGHVFRTDNYGITWEDITNGLPDIPHTAVIVDPLFPNNIYVGNDLGVFVSTNFGQSWEPYMEGLPEAVMVFDLKIAPVNRKLRVATHGNGAYERDLIKQTPPSSTFDQSKTISRLKVAPNPAFGQITLHFELISVQRVNIRLIDNTGRFIRQIYNNKMQAGPQIFTINTAGLSTGSYYLQVLAQDGIRVEKVQVVN